MNEGRRSSQADPASAMGSSQVTRIDTAPLASRLILRHSLRRFLPWALVVLSAAVTFYRIDTKNTQNLWQTREQNSIAISTDSVANTIDRIDRDLRYLSQSQAMAAVLATASPKAMADLASDWLVFSRVKQHYDQLRWLDEKGMERVRIDLKPDGSPVVVASADLQNKAGRYYFSEAFKLDAGEVYTSPLDLNVEHGKIEKPYKPMIRIGTPVFDAHGVKRGIILLNYRGADLLARFRRMGNPRQSLLNPQGYWLAAQNPADEWGFMFNKPELTLAQRHPQVWTRIAHEEKGQFETEEGLWTFRSVYPPALVARSPDEQDAAESAASAMRTPKPDSGAWKIVSLLPQETFLGAANHRGLLFGSVVAGLLLLSFTLTWRSVRSGLKEKGSDQALVESSKLLHSVIENLPVMLFLKQASDMRMVMFNKAGEQMLGYSRDEMLGKNDHDNFPKEQADFFTAKDRQVLDVSGFEDIPEEVISTKSGKELILHTVKIALRDEYGNPRYLLGISEDITERKRVEQALLSARDEAERANQAKSGFLSSMSHELRTPMNAILGFGQLLDYDETLPIEHRDFVHEILKGGHHLLKLINEVLDLSKVESGSIDLSLEPVAVDPVIDECLSLVAPLANERDIRLNQAGLQGAVVRADRTRLKQVMLNLLSNAIKYNRRGGQRTDRSGSWGSGPAPHPGHGQRPRHPSRSAG